MPYSEVPAFITKLRQRHDVTALALQFCILTAARSGEVLGARRDEFDPDAAVWTVPAERMKAGKEHRVPLSAPALQIIKAAMAQNTSGAFVFPAGSSGKALHGVLRGMGVAVTVHGFRSSFKDWCSECTSVANEVSEMALAHRIESGVEKAYRRGDLLEKRRDLMDAWARFCTNAGEADVVPLRVSSKIA
jgi:integrase